MRVHVVIAKPNFSNFTIKTYVPDFGTINQQFLTKLSLIIIETNRRLSNKFEGNLTFGSHETSENNFML